MKDYQVTLTSTSGKYRPVSTIVKFEEIDLTSKEDRKRLINKGTKKICEKRGWGVRELTLYGYTRAKIREYDKQAIEEADKAKYEAIKEAKYTSGEWQRPKKNT